MAQNYRIPLAKHREAKSGHGWTKLKRIEMDCIRVNLRNVGSPFFKLPVYQFLYVSKCHLHSWKIILSFYVATIGQITDSWSVYLTLRAHNQ